MSKSNDEGPNTDPNTDPRDVNPLAKALREQKEKLRAQKEQAAQPTEKTSDNPMVNNMQDFAERARQQSEDTDSDNIERDEEEWDVDDDSDMDMSNTPTESLKQETTAQTSNVESPSQAIPIKQAAHKVESQQTSAPDQETDFQGMVANAILRRRGAQGFKVKPAETSATKAEESSQTFAQEINIDIPPAPPPPVEEGSIPETFERQQNITDTIDEPPPLPPREFDTVDEPLPPRDEENIEEFDTVEEQVAPPLPPRDEENIDLDPEIMPDTPAEVPPNEPPEIQPNEPPEVQPNEPPEVQPNENFEIDYDEMIEDDIDLEGDIGEEAVKTRTNVYTRQAPGSGPGERAPNLTSSSSYEELKAYVNNADNCKALNLRHPVKEMKLSLQPALNLDFKNSKPAYAQKNPEGGVTYSASKNLSDEDWKKMVKNVTALAVANAKPGTTFDISHIESPEKRQVLEDAFKKVITAQKISPENVPKLITEKEKPKVTPKT